MHDMCRYLGVYDSCCWYIDTKKPADYFHKNTSRLLYYSSKLTLNKTTICCMLWRLLWCSVWDDDPKHQKDLEQHIFGPFEMLSHTHTHTHRCLLQPVGVCSRGGGDPCPPSVLRGSMTSLESSHSGFSQLSAATTSSSQSQSSSMISR